ncbi:MAG: polysaccharide deacetylase [Gammaproteobacteria bacterium]|nr:polysaccharide deacetylase [Gammaproteobacteria bacterium]MDH5214561.1 polysaccharide deacetylase [Gammaproteobacteria bacterium]
MSALRILTLFGLCATACAEAQSLPRWQQSPEQIRSTASQVRAGADLTPQAWPNFARVAVGLSFDVDTELVWLEDTDMQSPSTMSRGEYGARTGLPRVLALLAKYDIPATFFIPSMSMELHPEMVRMIKTDPRHEFGFHSYAHENPLALSAADERAAYEKGIELFVKHVGSRPQGFRSAAWDLTPATIEIVKALGFAYDSSMMADDRPYMLISEGRESGLIELPVEWILDDWPYFQLDWADGQNSMRNADDVYSIWRDEFDVAYEEGTMFILTMHPQVIGHRYRMKMLDRLIEHMKSRPDVWFATHAQIAAFVSQSNK